MEFIETSAKTSKNVDESFHSMIKDIVANMISKEKEFVNDRNIYTRFSLKNTSRIDNNI